MANFLGEHCDKCLATEVEGLILFLECPQAQIRADGRHRPFCASLILFDRTDQRVERSRLIRSVAKIDPGVEEQKARLGLCVLQKHRDYRKLALFAFSLNLKVESKEHLALLPQAKIVWPQEDCNGACRCESLLKRLRPRQTGHKINAVEKGTNSTQFEALADRRDGIFVLTVIAQE